MDLDLPVLDGTLVDGSSLLSPTTGLDSDISSSYLNASSK